MNFCKQWQSCSLQPPIRRAAISLMLLVDFRLRAIDVLLLGTLIEPDIVAETGDVPTRLLYPHCIAVAYEDGWSRLQKKKSGTSAFRMREPSTQSRCLQLSLSSTGCQLIFLPSLSCSCFIKP